MFQAAEYRRSAPMSREAVVVQTMIYSSNLIRVSSDNVDSGGTVSAPFPSCRQKLTDKERKINRETARERQV